MIDFIAHQLGFCAHGIDSATVYTFIACSVVTFIGWLRVLTRPYF